MREVVLVLTLTLATTLQSLARLSRLGHSELRDSDSCLSLIIATTHTGHEQHDSKLGQTYLCLRGKSTCVWSIKSWSWASSIVHRGANTPCLGWQQKYSILSTKPPWRPTGLNSSTPAHIPGWKENENFDNRSCLSLHCMFYLEVDIAQISDNSSLLATYSHSVTQIIFLLHIILDI